MEDAVLRLDVYVQGCLGHHPIRFGTLPLIHLRLSLPEISVISQMFQEEVNNEMHQTSQLCCTGEVTSGPLLKTGVLKLIILLALL